MAYGDFSLTRALKDFGLTVTTSQDLYSSAPAVAVGAHLATTLEKNVSTALLVHTEKARSEFIVAPVLMEVRWLTGQQVSLFSGTDLSVDPSAGLSGTCDFLFCRSPQQLVISAPILVVVEAKKDSIIDGLGQCAAEMVAVQRWNREQGTGIETVFGCVTTGALWRFLRLSETHLEIDVVEYTVSQVGHILGVFLQMVGHAPRTTIAA